MSRDRSGIVIRTVEGQTKTPPMSPERRAEQVARLAAAGIEVPEDDRPVGEVPPRFLYRDPTKPDPYQALLTQLHEARTGQADAWDEGYKSGRSDGVETEQRMQMRDWWAPMPETPNPYRALLDGEVRP